MTDKPNLARLLDGVPRRYDFDPVHDYLREDHVLAALSAALPADVAGVVEEAKKHRTELRDSLLPIAKTSDKHITDLISLATAQAARMENMIDADTVQKMLDSAQPIMAEACRGYEETIADLETTLAAERAKVAKLVEAVRGAAKQHRIIAGMDLMGASATAWNAARELEAVLSEAEARCPQPCMCPSYYDQRG